MNDLDQWRTGVLDHVEQLAGARAARQITEKWAEHAARERVEVTFVGPYSSGKSSLIRRLVADAGGSIPGWLTVSARPETYELNEVEAGALTFTDAPGFGGGRELHDALAQEALALSDAFLLVVPPSLLTTDRSFAGSVLSGELFFGTAGGELASVTVAAIGLADLFGVDPEDDPAGMRALADRKQAELRAQLQAEIGAPLDQLAIVCVAADPYEAQARTAQPTARDFDPYRSWDGIDDLSERLAELAERKAELRRRAEVRFLCRAARGITDDRASMLEEERSSAEDLRRRATDLALIRRRVDAVVDAARADLEEKLEQAFQELGSELSDEDDGARDRVNARLQRVITTWARSANPKLEEVLADAAASVEARLSSPAAQRTEAFLRSLRVDPSADPGDTDQDSRVLEILKDANRDMQRVARAVFETGLNRSLDDLLRRHFPKLPAFGDITQEQLDQTLSAATALVGLVGTGIDIYHDRTGAKRAAEARAALAATLRTAADDLAQVIVEGTRDEPGWRAGADAALDTLRDQLGVPSDDRAADRLLTNINEQQALVDGLRQLVVHGATLARSS